MSEKQQISKRNRVCQLCGKPLDNNYDKIFCVDCLSGLEIIP